MKRFLCAFVASVWLFAYIAESQSCDSFTEPISCAQDSAGACKWVNNACRCSSDVQLDILFGVDTSGSIGYNGFQIQKQFISNLVTQGINNGSRIGFIMFSTEINNSQPIHFWQTSDLQRYVAGLYWTAGWTNTPELMATALQSFATTYDASRQQVMMMITDGNPCLPPSLGGCPQSVCQYAEQVKKAGIRVVIIGVGDGLNTAYVSCLTQSDSDFIPVSSFSTDAFNSIMGSLSGILCPISKTFKVTEVKAEKKPDATWNSRWTRFVEVYNSGINFMLDDIAISGLISMTYGAGPSVEVSQGQYVVFYDASDAPTPATPSCHLCSDVCTLSTTNCPNAGLNTFTGSCWCENSIYVACSNSADGVTACNNNVGATGVSPINACSSCIFQDSGTSRTSWSITFSDVGETVDTVVYDANTWIVTEDGYSYELIAKGFDNDVGDNWAQSCSVLGTPGSDPAATCTAECTSNGCGSGGSCNSATGICDCDTSTGYYPQCSSATSCTKCLQVPQVEDCNVTWYKNGTTRFAVYQWTDADRDGNTQYRISYYDGSSSTQTVSTDLTYSSAYKLDNYYPFNLSYGGYVETYIQVCTGTAPNEVCLSYTSQKTLCNVITSAPTQSPTPSPTTPPTKSPTPAPTLPPTQACPEVFWLNNEVCHECPSQANANCAYKGDRCLCTGVDARQCCLLEPVWTGDYDPNRRHKTTDDCRLDVELSNPTARDSGGAGVASGYLLSEGDHNFLVGMFPEDYGCTVVVDWMLNFTRTDCEYTGSGRRRLQNGTSTVCDPSSNSLEQAGLAIDVVSGTLKIHGANDLSNATVSFTVTRLGCDAGVSCFRDLAIYGDLVISNATTLCRDGCYDGRIYPMRIPVWYNYQAAFVAPPPVEKELPAWLWWLAIALAVFLAVLLLLVYKYWWKNKATGAALQATQADLDAAVYEQEAGFGADLDGKMVGFNPLATGFNPNAPAGAANPNAPPDGNGADGGFIRPNVERPVFRQEYGQQYGAQR